MMLIIVTLMKEVSAKQAIMRLRLIFFGPSIHVVLLLAETQETPLIPIGSAQLADPARDLLSCVVTARKMALAEVSHFLREFVNFLGLCD